MRLAEFINRLQEIAESYDHEVFLDLADSEEYLPIAADQIQLHDDKIVIVG